jgi:hypothetical protein
MDLIRKKRMDEILWGDFTRLREPLNLLEVQEGYSARVEEVRSSEGQEPSIWITRSMGFTRGSAYREFAR